MASSGKAGPAVTREEAALLSWVEESSPYGVITTDRELRVRSWNTWMEQASGLPVGEAIGRKLVELFPNLAEPRFAGPFERALQGEVSLFSTALHHYLIPLPPVFKESGFEQMQQTARLAPLVLNDEILGTVIVIEDVTQRELQTAVVNRQHNREKILSWSLAHLLKAKDARRSVRELFYKVAEYFDFDAYFLYLRESEGGLRLHATGGITPEQERLLMETTEDVATSWVAASSSGEPLFFENAQKAGLPPDAPPARLDLRAYIVLALAVGDTVLGTLCLATRSRDTIRREEAELLGTISQYLAVALNREMTESQLRAAQAQLREHAQVLEREVSDRTVKLTETISELQTFSYSLAHDLRAPIRSMKGYCDVLLEDFGPMLPEDPKAVLDRLARSCDRLDAFTRDLLEFTRVSRQEIKLTKVETEPALSEVLNLSTPGLRNVVSVERPLLNVRANRGLLQRCLANLLENAFKFSESGKPPHISVRTEEIEMDAGSRHDTPGPFNSPIIPVEHELAEGDASVDPASEHRIRIWVEDNGIGIPADVHSKIFGIFERAAAADSFTGTGIGLAIVARAMQRMGGRCGVESQLGVGSRFWLELAGAEG